MRPADQIKYRLIRWLRAGAYDIIIPNYYIGRWEMDVMRVLSTGYMVEYEIKVSRADFKADFKKAFTSWRDKEVVNKHVETSQGKRDCNRFFFVTPEGMITCNEVPKYAGLMYCSDEGVRIVKNAPLLHKRKFEKYQDVAQGLSFREQRLRADVNFLKFQYEQAGNMIQNLKMQLQEFYDKYPDADREQFDNPTLKRKK